MGLQYSYECFCGGSGVDFDKHGSSNGCTQPCEGNKSAKFTVQYWSLPCLFPPSTAEGGGVLVRSSGVVRYLGHRAVDSRGEALLVIEMICFFSPAAGGPGDLSREDVDVASHLGLVLIVNGSWQWQVVVGWTRMVTGRSAVF